MLIHNITSISDPNRENTARLMGDEGDEYESEAFHTNERL